MTAHPMLHGPDYSAGAFYERERRHQRIIREKCAVTPVTAAELAGTVDHNGEVDAYRAAALIKTLIARAHDEAVGRTLGILPAQVPA